MQNIEQSFQCIESIRLSLLESDLIFDDPTYESGILGPALFYLYYSVFKNDAQFLQNSYEYIDKAIILLGTKINADYSPGYRTDSLDNMLANVGKFLQFSKKYFSIDIECHELLNELDDLLSDLLISKITIGDFDFNSGAFASGYYFLNRVGDSEKSLESIKLIISGLEAQAIKDEYGGFSWKSPTLDNFTYLGLSHGSAMVINFLSNVCRINEELKTLSVPIIERAFSFLIRQKRDHDLGLFPHNIENSEIKETQFSLCYGDLGIGYALFNASEISGNLEIEKEASTILKTCLCRPFIKDYTFDSSIIYGASGIAEVFDKLYRVKQDVRYKKAADYWYDKIFYYVYDSKVGLKCRFIRDDRKLNTSFGWGAIGIGISLMRCLDKSLPPLDNLLMIG